MASSVIKKELENEFLKYTSFLYHDAADNQEVNIAEGIRLAMQDKGIYSFVGCTISRTTGSTWPVIAVFRNTYNSGFVLRIAYGSAPIYKYRYSNSSWILDTFNPASSVNL